MKKLMIAMLACCAFVTVHAADLTWLTDVPKAQAQAKSENKLVLMNFTGSDWCPACIQLDKTALSQPEFADFAQKNLVLVLVDFPNNKPQSDELKAANDKLSTKYEIVGFPTLILTKPDGSVVWKQVGYDGSGAKALVDKLSEAKQK
jgi:thioredoxin-related protein